MDLGVWVVGMIADVRVLPGKDGKRERLVALVEAGRTANRYVNRVEVLVPLEVEGYKAVADLDLTVRKVPARIKVRVVPRRDRGGILLVAEVVELLALDDVEVTGKARR